MTCGFPAETDAEPPIAMNIELNKSLYGGQGLVAVHLELTTGNADMRMAAMAQPLGPISAPFVVIAGSPMQDILFQLGLKGDGSASLTIRDTRRGTAAEMTRIGTCRDHETFFMMFEGI